MPVFEYTGLDAKGKKVRGTLDAESMRVVRQRLKSQGVFATAVNESSAAKQSWKNVDVRKLLTKQSAKLQDVSLATRQLSTLVSAGLPLVSGLQALTDQTDNATLKRIIVEVREKVESGSSLAQALQGYPKIFPRLYINMVASGEASGMLDAVLNNLANYMESQLELRRKISSALMYPAIMLIMCTAVIAALLAFVVPKIVEIFQKQGAILPLPTRIMIALSDFVLGYWYVVIIFIVGAIATTRWYYTTPNGRSKIDRLLLRAPIYGPIYVKIVCSRVLNTLGALLGSGVGLLLGLEITKNIIGNVHYVKAIEDARDGVKEGRSFGRELSRSGLFPPMVWHMVGIGEKSGDLEGMLQRAGKSYESDVNNTLGGLTRLIEPLMMIGVGGVVLAIVISILLPMADLIDVVQG